MASLKTLSDATFEILGQFFRRVVSILAPNGVKKIAELGNSLRRLQESHFNTNNQNPMSLKACLSYY
ncbi:hypothetical protein LBPC_1951 [Lacticaseibacillus paracasei subsp. paracasei]|nr:hypothetical protein LBPC_1951 [Lacticaseibacillus paracasei subsp. paracasei]